MIVSRLQFYHRPRYFARPNSKVMDITQEEIIARYKELLELPVEETMREANELKSAFYMLNGQLLDQQKDDHRDAGLSMQDFIPTPNPLEDTFKELLSRYKDRKAKYAHQKKETEKKHLSEKKEVLKELEELIENEENIGKSFDRFKDLQDRWKSIGPIPKEQLSEVRTAYKTLVDRFYYNVSINRELKEYDLDKNKGIREAIVTKLEELQKEEVIKDIEFILAAAKEEWEEAGPVRKDDFKALRERYYDAVRTLHKKIQNFYSERKAEMQVNLEKKQELVTKVHELVENAPDSVGKWNKFTKDVFQLRDDWKTIGPVERKHHKKVWEEFRAAQDAFFDAKKAFMGEAKETFKENAKRKEKLVTQAEELKDSTEWKETTLQLIRLQKDWKRVGTAGHRDEKRLWEKFRGACDQFFNAKKEFFDTLDERQEANLKAKEAVLDKMKAMKLEGDDEAKMAAIKQLADEFAAIDHVPKKEVKRIATTYDKAINDLYKQAGLKQQEVTKVRFQNKVERLKNSDRPGKELDREHHFVQKRLREKKEELLQLENNMAFFSNSKPDNPLLLNAQKNIDNLKGEIERLTEELKVLNVSRRRVEQE